MVALGMKVEVVEHYCYFSLLAFLALYVILPELSLCWLRCGGFIKKEN